MDVNRIHEQTTAFAEVVEGMDPDRRVTTCPEWSLRVLVGHIGQEHRWAAGIVRTREAAPVPDPRVAEPPADWSSWLREGADELAAAVTAAGAAPVWTLLGPGTASFWLRRMVHDTTVHYVDAAITAGVGFTVAEDLAADGIEEGLELLASPGAESVKPGLAALRGAGQTLRFQPEGRAGWLITRTPGGVARERLAAGSASASADVTVSGSAQDLLLLFYRRIPADAVTITGQRELVTHWLAHTAL